MDHTGSVENNPIVRRYNAETGDVVVGRITEVRLQVDFRFLESVDLPVWVIGLTGVDHLGRRFFHCVRLLPRGGRWMSTQDKMQCSCCPLSTYLEAFR